MFPAYAKINLGLLVLNKRPDGYHNIITVFHRINLFDQIGLAPSEEIAVVSTSPEAPSDESNICHEAARLLRERLKIRKGVAITIEKNIPVGAGLGGGSSDAAAVLRNLPAFWQQSVDASLLHELALQLGSDVPYFLGRGSAVARGRGEILEYFPLDLPFTILLCNPNIHVGTAWAYGQLHPRPGRNDVSLRDFLRKGIEEPRFLNETLVNDFEPAVFHAFPDIRRLKEDMLTAGAVYASMSGSGSSVYGLFNDGAAAEKLELLLRARGYRTCITPPHFLPEE